MINGVSPYIFVVPTQQPQFDDLSGVYTMIVYVGPQIAAVHPFLNQLWTYMGILQGRLKIYDGHIPRMQFLNQVHVTK